MTEPNVNSLKESASGTSLSLLERARSQDQAAWERLVSLYTPLVDYWCRQGMIQEADVADVRQEVFMAVARHLADFRRDPAGGTFRGWLRTITRNKLHDHWRKTQGGGRVLTGGSDAQECLLQVPAADEEGSSSPLAEELGIVYRRAVELILTNFEERTRTAFWRVVVEGQRPAEVAAALGLSTNAVYLAKARILARLRQEFQDLLDQ